MGQNLFLVKQLGTPYVALCAFSPVIFLEILCLLGSPLLLNLPASDILHRLYSRGPDELQLPMQRNNFTPLWYCLWLDSQRKIRLEGDQSDIRSFDRDMISF